MHLLTRQHFSASTDATARKRAGCLASARQRNIVLSLTVEAGAPCIYQRDVLPASRFHVAANGHVEGRADVDVAGGFDKTCQLPVAPAAPLTRVEAEPVADGIEGDVGQGH